MKLVRPYSWRYTVHFCGWDRTCQSVYSPWYLYFHFLKNEHGTSPRVDLTPPRVRRRNAEWEDSLEDWQATAPPREKTDD